jgi:hypothetical protein
MKPILAYTLAIAIGVWITLKLLPASNDQETASEKTQKTEREKRGLSDSNDSSEKAPRFEKRQRPAERPKKVSDADFERWLASKKGDARSLAEAQAIVGLLTGNPDLIRQALEADPENPHLLYIGSTLSSFTEEERMSLSERFFKQDPQNGLAAYLYAAQLFKSGDTKKGLEILTGSQDQTRIDAYATKTQLLMDEAYIAKGLSPSEAKIQSTLSIGISYFSDLQSLADSIKDLGNSLPPNEAADLSALSASMAMRLNDQESSVTYTDHLVGLKLEEKTLAGLPDNSPSPYTGMTVEQARQAIAIEREEILRLTEQAPLDVIMTTHPELVDRYFERFRLNGELEATKWWLNETSEKK